MFFRLQGGGGPGPPLGCAPGLVLTSLFCVRHHIVSCQKQCVPGRTLPTRAGLRGTRRRLSVQLGSSLARWSDSSIECRPTPGGGFRRWFSGRRRDSSVPSDWEVWGEACHEDWATGEQAGEKENAFQETEWTRVTLDFHRVVVHLSCHPFSDGSLASVTTGYQLGIPRDNRTTYSESAIPAEPRKQHSRSWQVASKVPNSPFR